MELAKNIYYTGVQDYNIRTFDIIMHTEYGTTYNSYVVKGSEKTALIEIAKEKFFDEFMAKLSAVVDPMAIDIVVVNHTEPDHSGSLAKLLAINPNITVYGSQTAIKFLGAITNMTFKHVVVKDNDTLSLGDMTFKFLSVPLLHWPDSMYTYCEETKTLFSCDSFGCHYASDKVCNDLMDGDFLDAYKYYFDNIMGPFKSHVINALNKIKHYDIQMICPGHGPVLRKDIPYYLNLYREWATVHAPEKKTVAIPYVTSYGYTRKIAERIADGVRAAGDLDVRVFDMIDCDKSEMMDFCLNAQGLLVGSPTLVGDALPPVYELLYSLNPIIHKGKIVGAFGSYGWSGEAVGNMMDRFKQLRMRMPLEGLKINFNPSDAELAQAFEFGKAFGAEVLK